MLKEKNWTIFYTEKEAKSANDDISLFILDESLTTITYQLAKNNTTNTNEEVFDVVFGDNPFGYTQVSPTRVVVNTD